MKVTHVVVFGLLKNNMIIINLKGGLGNQMFQYAFGRAFSIKNDVEVKLDISGYPRQSLRDYKLSAFNIKENIARDDEVREYKYPFGIASKGWRFFNQRILRNFKKDYEPKLLEYREHGYIDGYFQSEKYFLQIREILLREFTLLKPLSPEAYKVAEKIREATIPISLHVRRGDYASDPVLRLRLGLCPIEYYEKATEIIANGFPEATFFIFSDDIAWVKENLSLPYSVIYVSTPGIEDYEELHLMSLCKHHIIANSSFSWWGAWLDSNPNKIVIAPKKWTNAIPDDHPNIIPESWTRI